MNTRSEQSSACPNCGAERRRMNARFCHKCGHAMPTVGFQSPETQAASKSHRLPLLMAGMLIVLLIVVAVMAIGPDQDLIQNWLPGELADIETPEETESPEPPPTIPPTESTEPPTATKTNETAIPVTTATQKNTDTPVPPTATPKPTDTPIPITTPKPTNTPVPPTATSASPSSTFTRYSHPSLRDYANSNTTDGYINPPLGQVELGGIPFNLGTGESIVTQADPLPNNPTQLSFSTDTPESQAVYFLITGGNLWSKYEGRLIGEVQLKFSGGGSHTVDLIAGNNIREWKHYQDNVVSRISNPSVTEVWRGANNDDSGAAVIDMLRIDVPAALRSQSLVSIEVLDQTQQTVGEMNPAVNLNGITVAYSQVATPTPAPTPTSIACSIQAEGRFAEVWREHRVSLGCPVGTAHITSAAWEPFEGGEMLWRGDVFEITAFYNGGVWETWDDKWEGGNPPYKGEPPSSLRTPCCGFAWIWGRQENVFRSLGWAKDEEKGVCLLVQDFERGFITRKSNVSSCKDSEGREQINKTAELPNLFIAAYDGGQSWVRR